MTAFRSPYLYGLYGDSLLITKVVSQRVAQPRAHSGNRCTVPGLVAGEERSSQELISSEDRRRIVTGIFILQGMSPCTAIGPPKGFPVLRDRRVMARDAAAATFERWVPHCSGDEPRCDSITTAAASQQQ